MCDKFAFLLLQVPKQYFDTCSIPSYANEAELRAMKIEKLKNCSSPFTSDFYLTLIDQFYALPGIWGGFLYNPGESYYFTCKSADSSPYENYSINNDTNSNKNNRRLDKPYLLLADALGTLDLVKNGKTKTVIN